jgi:hypothetical protein
MTKDTSHPSVSLPNEFLAKLIGELDSDAVTAIILHGSYVRGDARPPIATLTWFGFYGKHRIRNRKNSFYGMMAIS